MLLARLIAPASEDRIRADDDRRHRSQDRRSDEGRVHVTNDFFQREENGSDRSVEGGGKGGSGGDRHKALHARR